MDSGRVVLPSPRGLNPQLCLVRFVDLVKPAADGGAVQIIGLPNPNPAGEGFVLQPYDQIPPYSFVVVGADVEGVVDVVLVSI